METKSRARDGAPRFTPVDLDNVPEVDALLSQLGVGVFDRSSVTTSLGRNDNWSGRTSDGTQVFVKRINGAERGARLERTVTFCAASENKVATPRLMGFDRESGLLVFAYLSESRTGNELASDNAFDEALCARAGIAVAAVHGMEAAGFDTAPHPLPPTASLEAVTFPYYTQATAAELATWRLLHGDAELAQALRRLREADDESIASRVPIHGDMRLDQFLFAEGQLHLTDFEEARIGDAARDLGGFAGEWLFQAALRIPSTLADSSPMGHTPTHEEIIATGVGEIEQRSPLVRAFYAAYLEHAPAFVREDKELATRAAAYAGWHMMDRMLATASSSTRLSPVSKAAAGIGRTVLLSPAEFTSSLGLEA
ncbi:class V lanthionine synthetase subunit LxmK (plasmid) [Streptomyces sp. NBC_01558]|uniref:class V lanthionine synthetase subunit LxmK n=1 Tax=Streptomyces sp. NBC_01558 TaxID=2975878 RepID=UPI002DD9A584|nr:class V lanthionine synthetase subunit LxmK [Streptomyces sp. NBC_01558]WSD82738.1 class V lanthionine synthetase subunit LxmK [Streptomyces sp. NBC_01558]